MKFQLALSLFLLLLCACQTATPPLGGVKQAPTASFTASTLQGAAPLEIAFDASASSDDGTIATFNWTFGDGNSASGQTVSHRFLQAGQFTVTLSVTDNEGLSAEQTVQLTVTGAEPGNPGNPTPDPTSPGPTPSDPTNPAEPGPTEPDPANPAGESATLASSWDASLTVLAAPAQLTELAFDGVMLATQQAATGSVVATGTLTETAQGVFSYAASPADKLVVKRLDGAEFAFTFGDFRSGSGIYLSQDHSAIFQLSSNALGGSINAQIKHQRLPKDGSRVRDLLESFEGSYKDANGVVWTAGVVTQGEELSNVDAAGLESVSQTSGTLSADALGLTMNIARTDRFETINLVFDIGQTVADTWQLGGNTYQMNSVETRAIFRETVPVDTDQWIIAGTLDKNGSVIGQVKQDTSDPTKIQLSLFIGETILPLFSRSLL